MIFNKGKHIYKIIPMWIKRERVNLDPESKSKMEIKDVVEDVVEEKHWFNQDIQWSFNISMPRWMWILMCLFIMILISFI